MKMFLIAIAMCFTGPLLAADMKVVDEHGQTSEIGGVITSGNCQDGVWHWVRVGRSYYLICVPG